MDKPVYVFYDKDGIGVTGLTVDITVVQVDKSTLTSGSTSGSMSEIGFGFYGYLVNNVNFETYDYLCVAQTSGDVSQKHLPMIRWSDSVMMSSGIDGITIDGALKILMAVLAGKCDGGDTGTLTFRNLQDTKDVVVATVNNVADRLSVTIDVS